MTEQNIWEGQRQGNRLSQTHSEGFDILKLTIDAREGRKKGRVQTLFDSVSGRREEICGAWPKSALFKKAGQAATTEGLVPLTQPSSLHSITQRQG